jgi:hypothetical protein
MVKNVLIITWIAARVSFHGYREIQLEDDTGDIVLENHIVDEFMKDIKSCNNHVRTSYCGFAI